MRMSEIRDVLEARVLCGEDRLDEEISTAFACDMMSDVLACPDELEFLLTGLVNLQVVRTADMMDISLIMFVRGKEPTEDIINMAKQRNMVVMCTKFRMFKSCGLLYGAGLTRQGDEPSE